jgi:hypothetical protein
MKAKSFTISLAAIAALLLLLAAFFSYGRYFKKPVTAPKQPVAVCGKTNTR